MKKLISLFLVILILSISFGFFFVEKINAEIYADTIVYKVARVFFEKFESGQDAKKNTEKLEELLNKHMKEGWTLDHAFSTQSGPYHVYTFIFKKFRRGR